MCLLILPSACFSAFIVMSPPGGRNTTSSRSSWKQFLCKRLNIFITLTVSLLRIKRKKGKQKYRHIGLVGLHQCSPVYCILVWGSWVGVRAVPLSKVPGPQHCVVQDHDGRQRGKTDWVDSLSKQNVDLKRNKTNTETLTLRCCWNFKEIKLCLDYILRSEGFFLN